MERPRITLIGIAHILKSRELVDELITERSPDAVGVELDEYRYRLLIGADEAGNDEKVPFIIRRLAAFQDRIAKRSGAMKGEEMLSACRTARRLGVRLYFIDPVGNMDIKELFGRMGIREKLMILSSAVSAPFIPKKVVDRELDYYEKNQDEVMGELERKMPTFSKALITSRNRSMAAAIKGMAGEHLRIVAIVGDGHVKGIEEILFRERVGELEVIRLAMIRKLLKEKGDRLKEGAGRPADFSDLRQRESTVNLSVHSGPWKYLEWR